jgi:hypothetical protein
LLSASQIGHGTRSEIAILCSLQTSVISFFALPRTYTELSNKPFQPEHEKAVGQLSINMRIRLSCPDSK